jgi:hypothetical protein
LPIVVDFDTVFCLVDPKAEAAAALILRQPLEIVPRLKASLFASSGSSMATSRLPGPLALNETLVIYLRAHISELSTRRDVQFTCGAAPTPKPHELSASNSASSRARSIAARRRMTVARATAASPRSCREPFPTASFSLREPDRPRS